jgi:site-specific DNA-methyltransferase (adenine-specific)
MPGDLVVDPFNGSGTTGVASIRNGRKYIGIEKNEAFVDMAEMRLRAT